MTNQGSAHLERGDSKGGLSVLPRPGKLNLHFQALGVPRDLSRVLAITFYRWYEAEGPEGFVTRLKDLLNEVLTGHLAPWMRRSVSKNGLRQSEIVASMAGLTRKVKIRVLRCYTFVRLKVVTSKQEKKFFGSMSLPDVVGPTPDSYWWEFGDIRQLSDYLSHRKPWVPTLESYLKIRSKPKGYPVMDRRGRLFTKSEGARRNLLPKGEFDLSQVEFYSSCWAANGLVPDYVRDKWGKFLHTRYVSSDLPSGVVSGLQERGAKLRAVANPHPAVQWALEPLGNVLFDSLKQLERDCTHDQGKALPVVRNWLREGKRVHSVDLSDATNSFPLSWQLAMLRAILGPKWEWQVRLFEHVSRSEWVVGKGFPSVAPGSLVRWTKGQPLGLIPSFASFALAHHSLLGFLQSLYGGDYRILGDDVVIVGDRLHKGYLKWLSRLGVSYSPHKSISSNEIAEFAGMVITRKGWSNKWNDTDTLSASNTLGKMKSYGKVYSDYIVSLAKLTPVPDLALGAVIVYSVTPRHLGGLGMPSDLGPGFFNTTDTPLGRRSRYPGLPGRLQVALTSSWHAALAPSLGGFISQTGQEDLMGLVPKGTSFAPLTTPSQKGVVARFIKKVIGSLSQRQETAIVPPTEES